jgi:hypothetical protein
MNCLVILSRASIVEAFSIPLIRVCLKTRVPHEGPANDWMWFYNLLVSCLAKNRPWRRGAVESIHRKSNITEGIRNSDMATVIMPLTKRYLETLNGCKLDFRNPDRRVSARLLRASVANPPSIYRRFAIKAAFSLFSAPSFSILALQKLSLREGWYRYSAKMAVTQRCIYVLQRCIYSRQND